MFSSRCLLLVCVLCMALIITLPLVEAVAAHLVLPTIEH